MTAKKKKNSLKHEMSHWLPHHWRSCSWWVQKVLMGVGVLVLMVVLMELVGHRWNRGLGLHCPAWATRVGGGNWGTTWCRVSTHSSTASRSSAFPLCVLSSQEMWVQQFWIYICIRTNNLIIYKKEANMGRSVELIYEEYRETSSCVHKSVMKHTCWRARGHLQKRRRWRETRWRGEERTRAWARWRPQHTRWPRWASARRHTSGGSRWSDWWRRSGWRWRLDWGTAPDFTK